jgi:hypothetical protein
VVVGRGGLHGREPARVERAEEEVDRVVDGAARREPGDEQGDEQRRRPDDGVGGRDRKMKREVRMKFGRMRSSRASEK